MNVNDTLMIYLDEYLSLSEKERDIVKTAAKSGDSAMARQVLKLYFPKFSEDQIILLQRDLRSL